MEWHPEVESCLRDIIRLLLDIPDARRPEFQQDPYDNGMRILIDQQLQPGWTREGLLSGAARNRDTVLLHVLASLDGRELNEFRERNGRKWLREDLNTFLDQRKPGAGLHFAYHPYTGVLSDISSDWTNRYDGIMPMGGVAFFFSPEERDASLRDPDTGKRWPEKEIWACGEREALFHIIRDGERHPGRESIPLAECGCDEPRCGCRERAEPILAALQQEFREWQRKPG